MMIVAPVIPARESSVYCFVYDICHIVPIAQVIDAYFAIFIEGLQEKFSDQFFALYGWFNSRIWSIKASLSWTLYAFAVPSV